MLNYMKCLDTCKRAFHIVQTPNEIFKFLVICEKRHHSNGYTTFYSTVWKTKVEVKAIIFSSKQLQSLDLCIEINAPKFGGLVSSVLPVNTLDLLHVLI